MAALTVAPAQADDFHAASAEKKCTIAPLIANLLPETVSESPTEGEVRLGQSGQGNSGVLVNRELTNTPKTACHGEAGNGRPPP
jgi:hypothetical protein